MPSRGDGGAGAGAAEYFPRLSFDLIYARPGQSLAAWREELAPGAGVGGGSFEFVSADDRAWGRLTRRRIGGARIVLPDDALAEALDDATGEAAAKFWAAGPMKCRITRLPGAESRHNLAYWRYGDYAGIGPGAHGRLRLGGRGLWPTRRPPGAGSVGWARGGGRGMGARRRRWWVRAIGAREALLMGPAAGGGGLMRRCF